MVLYAVYRVLFVQQTPHFLLAIVYTSKHKDNHNQQMCLFQNWKIIWIVKITESVKLSAAVPGNGYAYVIFRGIFTNTNIRFTNETTTLYQNMKGVCETAKWCFWNHHSTDSLFSLTVFFSYKSVFSEGKKRANVYWIELCFTWCFLYPWQHRTIQEVTTE